MRFLSLFVLVAALSSLACVEPNSNLPVDADTAGPDPGEAIDAAAVTTFDGSNPSSLDAVAGQFDTGSGGVTDSGKAGSPSRDASSSLDAASAPGECAPGACRPLTGATAVAVGDQHSCALLSDGTVWCWGEDIFGELGDNGRTKVAAAVQAQGLSHVVSLAAGGNNTYAVSADGEVDSWGGYGGSRVPTTVLGVRGTGVSAAGDQVCILGVDGNVYCWSYANGMTAVVGPTMPVGAAIRDLAVGRSHACVLLLDGTAWCWGANPYGELGDGSMVDSSLPVMVTAVAGITGIAAGNASTCAMLGAASVTCWGYGPDFDVRAYPVGPTTIPGLAGVARIGSGTAETSCALLADGSVRCWGENLSGQTGDGSTDATATAMSALGVGNATAIATGGASSGDAHTCAVIAGGGVTCWGSGEHGQLGQGTFLNAGTAVTVRVLTSP